MSTPAEPGPDGDLRTGGLPAIAVAAAKWAPLPAHSATAEVPTPDNPRPTWGSNASRRPPVDTVRE